MKFKLWQICWKPAWYKDVQFSWFYAEDAAAAKEMLAKKLQYTPVIMWIEEG